ncbi:response regulator [Pedobacter insulae]|uniref:Response regulator receiver domain-containing protein n=1 Tax=Pedobacter insulae TaxID=414048 RepID=A0A1I2XI33_9SPHI|nr:response regulator [Pedobacter insulae]SFH13158.1 Response regulator receiver domain-containing protein [Pedobacter insulae]
MEVKTKKILIIDDDSRNIFALTAVLKAKKYACLSASSAKKGFSLIENDEDIAVVLMDMMMPDMDGYQAMSKMKELPKLKHIPVIAVTAQAMVGDKERCLEAGAVGYISKPINIEELVNQINKHL